MTLDLSVLIVILGMGMVTYLPRLMPFLLLTRRPIPRRLNAFLRCIPAAALGALIIPGALQATPEAPLAAIAGMGFTLVYGFVRGGMIIPVLGSVAVTYLVLMMGL